jgi:hypothetical protein
VTGWQLVVCYAMSLLAIAWIGDHPFRQWVIAGMEQANPPLEVVLNIDPPRFITGVDNMGPAQAGRITEIFFPPLPDRNPLR